MVRLGYNNSKYKIIIGEHCVYLEPLLLKNYLKFPKYVLILTRIEKYEC